MAVTAINARSNLATDPIRNFRFLVRFEQHDKNNVGWTPNASLGFTSVSGLAVTTDSIPYREGGYNTTVHQIPGQSQFSPVTFQRGVMVGSKQHWDWMRMLFQTVGSANSYTTKTSFRSDVVISVLNHPVPFSNDTTDQHKAQYGSTGVAAEASAGGDDLVVMRFVLYNAWPTSLAYSDLNAGDNALMVEQMTLVHEGIEVLWGTVNSDGAIKSAPNYGN